MNIELVLIFRYWQDNEIRSVFDNVCSIPYIQRKYTSNLLDHKARSHLWPVEGMYSEVFGLSGYKAANNIYLIYTPKEKNVQNLYHFLSISPIQSPTRNKAKVKAILNYLFRRSKLEAN